MARPRANIDWDKVDKYLQAQCDGTGIAGLLGISPDTLYRACQSKHNIGFDAYSAIKRGEGKELLRAKQFKMAMDGDKTMAIWLGKQYLHQSDKQELTGKDGKDLIQTVQIEIINSASQVRKDDSGS